MHPSSKMKMNSKRELHLLYSQFVRIWNSGEKAKLNLRSENGAVKACLESSLLPAYMVRVHPSEESGPAGGADLLHVVLSQGDTLSGQLGEGASHVNHRLVVPADISPPEVVSQHQHDVGPAGRHHGETGQEEEEEEKGDTVQ